MGKAGAYLEYGRHYHGERPTEEAIHDFDDYTIPLSEEEQQIQASRCMMCGVAFVSSEELWCGLVFQAVLFIISFRNGTIWYIADCGTRQQSAWY